MTRWVVESTDAGLVIVVVYEPGMKKEQVKKELRGKRTALVPDGEGYRFK
ncbi:hypothetical protein [Halalkalibacter krulwichiae]|uniref:Uncharacterized protein n=1 Tax=Halalkalibacter krulwichiae TaxID=199441 RepID=A0A1X9M5P5_9BACI|nr:hypothetical protein [Halalkalibacter krulwichiae]ARK28767.1 hypothetical protein BkAM31D_02270 [Halalkalibacter krulwichiae]